jgi:tetratricopeptide (TPR) repeat protein
MEKKSTVALTMIVKDELEAISKMIDLAYPFFDQLVFAVSDETTSRDLEYFVKEKMYKNVEVYYRPWNNRFDEARNYVLDKVKTDYWFWLDADDEFDFRAIPKIVELAEANGFDEILLPYNYAQDERGNCIAFHWRERLMRTAHPFEWKGWIHETPVTNLPFKGHKVRAEVIHKNGEEHVQESLDRNHKILLEATAASDDPRYQLYLGTSHHARGEWGEAVEVLDKFIKVSGSTEDIYRALNCMSECAFHMKRPSAAMQYAMQAAAQIPEYPQAYWLMAQWESEQGNWAESIEWVEVSEIKQLPTGMTVFDPTSRDRARLIAAQDEFMMENYNEALKWLRRTDPKNPVRLEIEADFINEADAETFVTLLPKFRRYFANDEALYNSLCYDLKYDTRLRGLREQVEEPKVWADNSIVILVGQGYEEWGPHTLDQGMGGSEEAVVYLSRELAQLGWEVTVYGAVDTPVYDVITENTEPVTEKCRVTYLPWKELNRQDTFNIFVAWRAPDFTEHVKAKVKVADIHDVLNKTSIKDYADVTYFVKSNWHRNLYPELPDEKFRVIGNGISKEQFE